MALEQPPGAPDVVRWTPEDLSRVSFPLETPQRDFYWGDDNSGEARLFCQRARDQTAVYGSLRYCDFPLWSFREVTIELRWDPAFIWKDADRLTVGVNAHRRDGVAQPGKPVSVKAAINGVTPSGNFREFLVPPTIHRLALTAPDDEYYIKFITIGYIKDGYHLDVWQWSAGSYRAPLGPIGNAPGAEPGTDPPPPPPPPSPLPPLRGSDRARGWGVYSTV